jgi:uncharacterized protein YcfJ
MLKKIVSSTLVLIALTGCATHQQANTAVGAGAGAVIGNAVGGRGGAVAGAIVGSMIGSQQPTQSNQPIYVERYVIPDRSYQCRHYIERERNCYNMRYRDTRAMCIEDARNHYQNCMYR